MIGDPHAQAVLLGQRQYAAIGGFVEPAFAGRADGGEAGVGDLRHAGVVEQLGQRWRAPERQDERADRGGLADGRTNDAAGEDEQERERDEDPSVPSQIGRSRQRSAFLARRAERRHRNRSARARTPRAAAMCGLLGRTRSRRRRRGPRWTSPHPDLSPWRGERVTDAAPGANGQFTMPPAALS